MGPDYLISAPTTKHCSFVCERRSAEDSLLPGPSSLSSPPSGPAAPTRAPVAAAPACGASLPLRSKKKSRFLFYLFLQSKNENKSEFAPVAHQRARATRRAVPQPSAAVRQPRARQHARARRGSECRGRARRWTDGSVRRGDARAGGGRSQVARTRACTAHARFFLQRYGVKAGGNAAFLFWRGCGHAASRVWSGTSPARARLAL